MINYPSDWAHDSYFIYAINDDLSQRVNMGYTAGMIFINLMATHYSSVGVGFASQQTPAAVAAGISLNDPSSYEMFCADGAPGTFAQIEYSGWGFQMNFRLGAALGIVDIWLDGAGCIGNLDLYSGACGLPFGATAVVTGGAGVGSVLVTVPNLPLDAHRVKIYCTGFKNVASGGYAAIYPALQVMY
jgi:hypothetical protein